MVSHHSANFSGHRRFVSGDVMVLFCQVVLKDSVTKGLINFIGRVPSK